MSAVVAALAVAPAAPLERRAAEPRGAERAAALKPVTAAQLVAERAAAAAQEAVVVLQVPQVPPEQRAPEALLRAWRSFRRRGALSTARTAGVS